MTGRGGVVGRLYEVVTGRPWVMVRTMSAEFGVPPGAWFVAELSAYSDAELYARGEEILAEIRAERRRARGVRRRQGWGSDRVAAGPNPDASSWHENSAGTTWPKRAPAMPVRDGLPLSPTWSSTTTRRQGRFASLRDGLRPPLTPGGGTGEGLLRGAVGERFRLSNPDVRP